jgi:hypothetical protein|tara:strand:- start:163 stop:408 length:246 start_codon:yes stop_codon:yes gene_type:complete
MEVQIEKNAPLPDRRKGWGKWQKLIEEMDVGDAAILEDDENLTAYHGLRRAAKSMGFTVSMRTLDDGKIKVWKQEAIEDTE